MSDIATVYAVFSSADEASRVGRAMVERRLAACVNILAPATSIYRWEGQVVDATEVPALFKTDAKLVQTLIEAIADAHGYDIPAILSWNVEARHPAYAAWVRAETRPDGADLPNSGRP